MLRGQRRGKFAAPNEDSNEIIRQRFVLMDAAKFIAISQKNEPY